MKEKTTVQGLLAEPVNLDELIAKLDFAEENIIEANREQPSLFLEASRFRVKKMRSRIQSEAAFETSKTEAAMFLRAKKKLGKGNFTEGYIKDKVATHPTVIEAKEKFDRTEVHEEYAKLLLEAYRQRGHAIKTLAEILGAEANAQARIARKDAEIEGFEKLKQKVRNKYNR